MKLCTCNQCGQVYHDWNPGNQSIEYDNILFRMFGLVDLPAIRLDDGHVGYGCVVCKTDGYLVDNINPFAGGKAREIQRYLDQAGPLLNPVPVFCNTLKSVYGFNRR